MKEYENLKKLKSNLIKNGKKKYKNEIKILNNAMKKLKKQKRGNRIFRK